MHRPRLSGSSSSSKFRDEKSVKNSDDRRFLFTGLSLPTYNHASHLIVGGSVGTGLGILDTRTNQCAECPSTPVSTLVQ